jgi:outer membrane receptor protein involved in Fe transport
MQVGLVLLATSMQVDAGAAPAALEPVLVTGTRLVVPDAIPASPIVVVAQEMLLQGASVSVERTLARFPQFVPVAGATSNDPGNDGQANLSLRGVGAAQTLVLLDGRRVTPADGRGIVDLNVIPPALIDSVEVVTGGASAVYGSDAVAGVVNIHLKPSFDGVEARGSWSSTARGDGEEYAADLTAGTRFASGRGSLMASAGYARRELLYQDDRSRSRQPLRYYPDESGGVGPGHALLDYGATITADGLNIVFSDPAAFDEVFSGYGFAPGSVPYYAGIGVNRDGSLYTIGDQVHPGTVVNYRGVTDSPGYNDRVVTTNLAPETALQLPLERKSLFLHGSFDVTDETSVLFQLLYADYTSSLALGPPDSGILLAPPTNPYVPADLSRLLASRANPDVPFRLLKRLVDLPNRVATNDRDLLQLTAAVDGSLAGEWRYQAHVQWGRNNRDEQRSGNALTGEIESLLNEPDGGVARCGEINLFGLNPIAPACAAQITADATNTMEVNQFVAEAVLHGTLATLPAGDLQAAVGVFYKRDEFSFRADPLAASQLPAVPGVIGPRPVMAGFPIAPSRDGSESNADAFVELHLPLWRADDGSERLYAGLGYRRADYHRAGGFDSYKAELLFRPATSWRLRGSYQRALRAPSVDELFFPQLLGQLYLTPPDPCSVSSAQRQGPDGAAVRDLCLAQGMPEALIDRYEYPLARVEGVTGGNPDLSAEHSTSMTAGIEYSANVLAGAELTLALDWYRIELADAIGRWDTDTVIHRCFDPAYNPAYVAGNAYCSYFERSPSDGTIFSREIDRNSGGIDTRGIDLRVAWRHDLGPGRAGMDAYVGYVDEWTLREPHGGAVQLAGTIGARAFGGSLPRWKSLLTADYAWRDWRVFTTFTHLDGMRDALYREFEVPSASYLGAGIALDLQSTALAGATLEAGVENLTDTAPPLFPSYPQANTDPSQYDVLGRRYWLSLRCRF